MPQQWTKPGRLVLYCWLLLVPCACLPGSASCPGGWQLFEDSCYRLTKSKLHQDQLMAACRQLGGAAVSIHSSKENNFVGRVASGNYVWLGMRLTQGNQYTWDDGTRHSYSKFLPSGNRMLKRAFVGAGVLQQSCLRWNYDRVSRQLYGVCKMDAIRCPAGSVAISKRCYFVSARRVPWWESSSACHRQDGLSEPVTLAAGDRQLLDGIQTHFGAATKLIAGVSFLEGSCSWTSTQYGQLASHGCQFGCPDLLPVICSRPRGVVTDRPNEPVLIMPLIYNRDPPEARSDQVVCPDGWTARGTRCVSSPTPAVTRQQAPAACQQRHNSRLATIRHASSTPILALQLETTSEAWVVDERPVASLRSSFGRGRVRVDRQTDIQPEQHYSVLTADGQVLARPAHEQRPAVCEHCREPCGPGAMAFSGLCYKVLEEPRTLQNASRSCAELGGTLASVETLPENRFLTALAFPSSAQCGGIGSQLWLGLQRISAAFSWEWEDCSLTSAKAWAPGAGDSGLCVTLSQDGLWRDTTHCDQRLRAACKWDPCRVPGQPGGACLLLHSPGPIY